jgi:cysteine desulfurase
MLGNNETGVLQPVAQLAQICREAGVPLHTDAVQVAGKLPICFHRLGAATMSISAHKFHGPRGIGALLIRHDTQLWPLLFGGFQQGGLRPGTESVTLAVGMATALSIWQREQHERLARLTQLRDRFESAILAGWPGAVIHGRDANRLPHTSNISFPGLDRQASLMALDLAGVACSTGSACASGSTDPSTTLVAMGCPQELLSSSLRFSLGATTTLEETDRAASRILKTCNDLGRASSQGKLAATGRISIAKAIE